MTEPTEGMRAAPTQTTLQTDRIRLVPLSEEHLDFEIELDSDPEVMRYLTRGERTRAQIEKSHGMRLATAEPVPGLGFWAGFVREEFVGWWLLEPAGWGEGSLIEGEAELGYRLLRRHWGRGLASEGSRELLRHAFEDLALNRVFALTMKLNERSQATMAGSGLAYVRTFPVDEAEWPDWPDGIEHGGVEYAITADEWRAARAARAEGASGPTA